MQEQTAVTQKQNISFINKIKNRTVIGYKYFRFDGAKELLAEIRGDFAGEIFVSTDEEGKNEIGRAAIAAEIDNDGADLDALETEARAINEEIEKLAEEQFFHADYDATLKEVYGDAVDPDNLVVEGGVVE